MSLTQQPINANGNQNTAAQGTPPQAGSVYHRELVRVGATRQRARAQASEASRQLRVIVRQAHSAGLPKIEITRLAQISRPALDTMLGERTPEQKEAAALRHVRDLHRATSRVLDDVYRTVRW
jgi:hypothetical protein